MKPTPILSGSIRYLLFVAMVLTAIGAVASAIILLANLSPVPHEFWGEPRLCSAIASHISEMERVRYPSRYHNNPAKLDPVNSGVIQGLLSNNHIEWVPPEGDYRFAYAVRKTLVFGNAQVRIKLHPSSKDYREFVVTFGVRRVSIVTLLFMLIATTAVLAECTVLRPSSLQVKRLARILAFTTLAIGLGLFVWLFTAGKPSGGGPMSGMAGAVYVLMILPIVGSISLAHMLMPLPYLLRRSSGRKWMIAIGFCGTAAFLAVSFFMIGQGLRNAERMIALLFSLAAHDLIAGRVFLHRSLRHGKHGESAKDNESVHAV